MSTTVTPRQARARLAIHSRNHPTDESGIAERQRDLKAANLEKHIREVVESAPPLTEEQRSRLSVLLRGKK